jgi:hypothetical protein
MLQTRLAWINENLDAPAKTSGLFRKAGDDGADECFICSKIDAEFSRIGSNIAAVWGREADFRALYAGQEHICYPHARALIAAGRGVLRGAALAEFTAVTAELARKRLLPLKADIDAFCNMFDYRNAGAPDPGSGVATAIERAIEFLT